MEIKTPMVFVKHITAAQRGNATSIQYLCDHTSSQFVKICRGYDLSNNEIEAVLAKAYGLIFANIKSVKNPQTFMSWASGLVEECCEEIAQKKEPAERPVEPVAEKPAAAPAEPAAGAPVAAGAPAAVAAAAPVVAPAPVVAAPAVEPAPVAAAPVVEPAPVAAAPVAAPAPVAETPAVEPAPVAETPAVEPAPVAAAPAVEPAPVAAAPVVRPAAPSAFYDENAYLEPATTFEDSITYADHSLTESAPVDKRVIPVDELVYHPEEAFMGSEETPAAPAAYVPPVHVEDEPDVDLREREAQVEKAPEPEETSYDEEDIDVSESDYDDEEDEEDDEDEVQSGLAFRTKVLIGLLCVFIFGACVGIGYAISKGMAGNDIEMTSNSGNQPTPDAGAFASSGELIDETAAASVVIGGDTSNATDRPADDPNASPDNTASDAQQTGNTASDVQQAGNTASDAQQTGNTASDAQQTGNTASDVQQAGTASDAQQTDGTASTGPSANKSTGEVTARADLGTYVGETFASVFRDYPDLKRSVYRGELSYANDFVCFMGSYDATQPVSSTIVESVSLLTESKDFNINGFYIGMAAADAESQAVAGKYTEKEMSAESSREYLDPNGNILTLTIDSEVIKNAALRLASANEL